MHPHGPIRFLGLCPVWSLRSGFCRCTALVAPALAPQPGWPSRLCRCRLGASPPCRLCAVMLDTLGRELMIKRKYGVDENGWPGIFEQLRVTKGQKVRALAGGRRVGGGARGHRSAVQYALRSPQPAQLHEGVLSSPAAAIAPSRLLLARQRVFLLCTAPSRQLLDSPAGPRLPPSLLPHPDTTAALCPPSRQVTITTDTNAACTNEVLPITYPKFPAMCEVRPSRRQPCTCAGSRAHAPCSSAQLGGARPKASVLIAWTRPVEGGVAVWAGPTRRP